MTYKEPECEYIVILWFIYYEHFFPLSNLKVNYRMYNHKRNQNRRFNEEQTAGVCINEGCSISSIIDSNKVVINDLPCWKYLFSTIDNYVYLNLLIDF